MMAYVPQALRDLVMQRANGRCEYCQAAQKIIVDLEIDHIKPESRGGATDAENLSLACAGCNSYKHNYETARDPINGEIVPLFNPRNQRWTDHFQWDDSGTRMIGLTSVGRATIERLKINRAAAVVARQSWVKVGWHPPQMD